MSWFSNVFGGLSDSAVGAVGSIGSAIIGGGASIWGGHEANKQSLSSARDQMAFQERMRDTAYQSAVKDMEKAGINPMLAYIKGGSAVPSGASYSAQNTMAEIPKTVQNGLALAQANADINQKRAQINIQNEQAQLVKAQQSKENLELNMLRKSPALLALRLLQGNAGIIGETFGSAKVLQELYQDVKKTNSRSDFNRDKKPTKGSPFSGFLDY